MDTLNGQTADLDVELKIVDEANSTNNTVYSNDWDSPEVKTAAVVDVLGRLKNTLTGHQLAP